MPTGTCLCGEIKISYTGEPAYRALCYCTDCRKMSNAQTHQVPKETFTLLSGTPKTYTKISDFSNEITSHFCPTCGTTLYRTGGAPQVEGMVGIRAGVLDDQSAINGTAPQIEVFVDQRPTWVRKVEGAMQMDSKYEVMEGGESVKGREG